MIVDLVDEMSGAIRRSVLQAQKAEDQDENLSSPTERGCRRTCRVPQWLDASLQGSSETSDIRSRYPRRWFIHHVRPKQEESGAR